MRNRFVAILATLIASSTTADAAPRVPLRPAGMGSAIAVEYSIHPDSLRPGEAVPILACVANQNPSSTRDLETGDAFTFEFTRGVLGACTGVALAMPGTAMIDSDFTCSVDAATLTLTYRGVDAIWPPGQAICATVTYYAEDAPSMVLTRTVARRVGGHAPAATAGVLLGVAADLGVAGPVGPQGPIGDPGPQGLPGTRGIGERRMLVATSEAHVREGEPPVTIPGLETTIDAVGGENLLVILDVANFDCHGPGQDGDARVYIEVDGVQVASRNLEDLWQIAGNVQVTWLSDPLAPGPHTVRGLLSGNETQTLGTPIPCIGAAAISRHYGAERMIVMEVLP